MAESIVDDVTGVLVAIGNDAKEDNESGSIAGQIAILRRNLKKSVENVHGAKIGDNVFDQVIKGEKILFIRADESNIIQRIIMLKTEIEKLIQPVLIKITLVGGAEAWKVAHRLGEANINVMLFSARCTPGSWETRSCMLPNGVGIGQDFINGNISTILRHPAADLLRIAGVNVGLGFEEDNFARGLLWEAAWIYQDSVRASEAIGSNDAMTPSEAIGMITWDAAEINGANKELGKIVVGDDVSLNGFNADPILGWQGMGGLHSHIKLVISGSTVVCNPSQV